jgi:periplasmic protein TonB
MSASHEARPRTGHLVRAEYGAQKIRELVEYRAEPDATLPPTPLRELLAEGGASVAILSGNRNLVDVVERAAGDQYPTHFVESWHTLHEEIDSGRCGIVLLDAGELGAELERRLADLRRYGNRLVTLVAADRPRAEALVGYLSSREIHRLLITPPTVGITRLLIESAVARYLQLRDERERGRAAPLPPPHAAPFTMTAKLIMRTRPVWPIALGLVSLLGAIVVIGSLTRSWWPSVVQPRVETRVPDGFEDILARGRLAFNEGRLAAPAGDSALDYYLTVLAANPEHREAQAQLESVVDALFAQAEAALVADSVEQAAAALDQVRRAAPTSARLAFLDNQVQRSREALQAAAAAELEVTVAIDDAPPTSLDELDELLTLAESRIRQGQLLQPAADSARAYLQRATTLAPGDPRIAVTRANLAVAVAAAARTVLDSGDLAQSQRLVAEARALGTEQATLTAIESQMQRIRAEQAATLNSALLSSARARMERNELIAPEGNSALHYFETLRAADPGFPGLAAAWQSFLERLAQNARTAIGTRNWTTAESWIAALTTAAPDDPLTRAVAEDIAVARKRLEYLETAAPASELMLTAYRPPVYPPDAQRAGIDGWVQLEFVVGEDGQPREAVVVRSEPAGRFDRPALEALATYRYEPFVLDGHTYARRVWLRMRFSLQPVR